ncbi:MAG TPA: arsinothricin resistance N-acetyltransferase ArsN1 family A [bacterium]|nr:arsinothricin resistance N-acetyltransferase ArsN1 family A [bacterium]
MLRTRAAVPDDAEAIARIYNEGIEDRVATFETRPRSAEDVGGWFDGVHPIVVAEDGGRVLAFASTSTYRPRDCYAGIAEFSVYVAREARGRGAGRAAMEALIAASERAGFWKLVSRVFPQNTASLRLLKSLGFREVGYYEKHAKLDGAWLDVVIVERLLPANVR